MDEFEPDMRRWLLGTLSEGEREEIAERLLLHDDVNEAMIAEEQRLVDEYVSGTLTTEDSAAFQSQCRVRPDLAERIAIASILTGLAKRQDTAPSVLAASVMTPKPTRRGEQSLLWLSVAATLVVTIGSSLYLGGLLRNERRAAFNREQYWTNRDREEQRQISILDNRLKERQAISPPQGNEQREAYWKKIDSDQRRQIEELNRRLAMAEGKSNGQAGTQQQLLSLLILPETRGTADNKTLPVPSKANQIYLLFAVDNPEGYTSFSIKLSSGGQPVLDKDQLRVTEQEGRWIVPVEVPTAHLGPGKYDATLFGVKDGKDWPLSDYHFELSPSE